MQINEANIQSAVDEVFTEHLVKESAGIMSSGFRRFASVVALNIIELHEKNPELNGYENSLLPIGNLYNFLDERWKNILSPKCASFDVYAKILDKTPAKASVKVSREGVFIDFNRTYLLSLIKKQGENGISRVVMHELSHTIERILTDNYKAKKKGGFYKKMGDKTLTNINGRAQSTPDYVPRKGKNNIMYYFAPTEMNARLNEYAEQMYQEIEKNPSMSYDEYKELSRKYMNRIALVSKMKSELEDFAMMPVESAKSLVKSLFWTLYKGSVKNEDDLDRLRNIREKIINRLRADRETFIKRLLKAEYHIYTNRQQ